jgi:hypothetical protein
MEAHERARLTKIVKEMRTTPLDHETEALRDWLGCLSFLWESVGRKIDGTPEDDKQFDAYAHLFEDVPLALLEQAIKRAIANNGKFKVVPMSGSVFSELRKILELRENEDIFESLKIWRTVQFDKCIVRFEVTQ